MNEYHWTLVFLTFVIIFIIFDVFNNLSALVAIFVHFGLTTIYLLEKIKTSLEKPDVS